MWRKVILNTYEKCSWQEQYEQGKSLNVEFMKRREEGKIFFEYSDIYPGRGTYWDIDQVCIIHLP